MLPVGGASRTMTVCGATESILISSFNYLCDKLYMRQYISRRKYCIRWRYVELSVIRWTN